MSALRAFVSGYAFPWVSAGQKSFNGMGDNRAKETVVLGIDAMIAFLKVAEVAIDYLEQRTFVE